MISKVGMVQSRMAEASARANAKEEYVCWSRMQAEAGQPLEAIIARKERERRAGRGVFLWGVGNAPAMMTKFLVRANVPVRVVFSIMKSQPKVVDVAPTQMIAWRRYIDARGIDRELPPHVVVTSRGNSATGAKRVHYALMCRCEMPLVIRRGEVFDPHAYRNIGGKGAPVGASQVTALLRRVHPERQISDYEANLVVCLTGSYWVRLVDPVEIDEAKRRLIDELSIAEDDVEWCHLVAAIRSGSSGDNAWKQGDLLF